MTRPSQPTDGLERYVVPNLRNACHILKLLADRTEGYKTADIARELDLPVTTTLRIMATLQLEGFVRKTESRFELGPVLVHLGNASLSRIEIHDAALPVLQSLSTGTDETAHLAVPCDRRSLIVAVHDSAHPLRAASRPGFLADLHCSSTGKVLLAFHYFDQLDALLARAKPARRTPHTLTTLSEIRREIELTRKRGYALDDEEFHAGVRCLAAPVYSSRGTCVAAIGITAAAVRLPRSRVPEIAVLVIAAAAQLSSRLGFRGPDR